MKLLNDLEAMAHGILLLRPDEVEILNAGTPPPHNQALALIAAGTGLGESILFWNGSRYQPMPSEGGHADFAPNDDNEIELLRHLRSNYLHVSYERVLSGPGLHAIYDYVRDSKKNEPTWLSEQIKAGDPAAVIAEAGLKGQADIAKQALDLFASIYGAEAGNLALKAMTLNGVYLGGGIAPKLIGQTERRNIHEGLHQQRSLQTLDEFDPGQSGDESADRPTRCRIRRRSPLPYPRIMMSNQDLDSLKKAAALKAVEFVRDGMVVGLGTGSTAKHMVIALGEKVRAGMTLRGVPTSKETATLATQQGITLIDADNAWVIDVAIDGADQVDPGFNLIKGGGGALLKEKIVAASAKQFIVLVDHTKRVPVLGGSFPLPIEVIPFGWGSTAREIEALTQSPCGAQGTERIAVSTRKQAM